MTPQQQTKVTPSQIYATIGNISGTWSVVTLPARSSTVTKARDGGAQNEESLASKPTYGDLTLRRTFDRSRDFAAWRRLNDQVGKMYDTITVPVEDVDGIVVDHFTYTGLLMSCTPPSGDAQGTGLVDVQIIFSIDSAV